MERISIKQTAFAALFTVLIIIGAYIILKIPGTPVPVVLQNMFILLTGLLLGYRLGFYSVAAYLILGALGLPVFSGGKGGFVHFLGPTGGYLVSYIFAVVITGYIANYSNKNSWIKDLIALIAGTIIIYLFGAAWLKIYLASSWDKALSVGVLPFLPGDTIKITAAVLLAIPFRKFLKQILRTDGQQQ